MWWDDIQLLKLIDDSEDVEIDTLAGSGRGPQEDGIGDAGQRASGERERASPTSATPQSLGKGRRTWHRPKPVLLVVLIPVAFATLAGLLVVSLGLIAKADISDKSLAKQTFAAIPDTMGNYALSPHAIGPYGNGPQPSFSLTFTRVSGSLVTGSFAFVGLSSPGFWTYSIPSPAVIYFVLPEKAVQDPDTPGLIAVPRACAAWVTESGSTDTAKMEWQTVRGAVLGKCRLPAVGNVKQLLLSLTFKLKD